MQGEKAAAQQESAQLRDRLQIAESIQLQSEAIQCQLDAAHEALAAAQDEGRERMHAAVEIQSQSKTMERQLKEVKEALAAAKAEELERSKAAEAIQRQLWVANEALAAAKEEGLERMHVAKTLQSKVEAMEKELVASREAIENAKSEWQAIEAQLRQTVVERDQLATRLKELSAEAELAQAELQVLLPIIVYYNMFTIWHNQVLPLKQEFCRWSHGNQVHQSPFRSGTYERVTWELL